MDNTIYVGPTKSVDFLCDKPTNILKWVKEGNEKVLMQLWVSITDGKQEWRKVPEE